MEFVRRGDHMRICLLMIVKARPYVDDGRFSKATHYQTNTLPSTRRRKGELLPHGSLGRQPVSLYHELEKGTFVLAFSSWFRVLCLGSVSLQAI